MSFIYLWTNKKNGKKYIGSHKGTPSDGYVGSNIKYAADGRWKTMYGFIWKWDTSCLSG